MVQKAWQHKSLKDKKISQGTSMGEGDKIKIKEPLIIVISKTQRNIDFHEWIGKEPQFYGFHYFLFFEISKPIPWFYKYNRNWKSH